MEIPKIKIPQIDIPVHNPYQVLNVPLPSLKIPGCVKYHRDAKPSNTALYSDDPTGTVISCPSGSMPSFQPLLYNRRRIQIVETKQQTKQKQEEIKPKVKTKKPKLPKQKKKEFFIKCPGDKDQRVGDFRNDKKLERVIGHKLSDDKSECITLYEDTKFIDQYLPSAKAASTAAGIALVAATTPLLINAVKPLVKQLINRITKKKDQKNP